MSEEKEAYQLPEGWVWSTLKDIVVYSKGKKPKLSIDSIDGYIPYLDIAAFEKNNFKQYAQIESSNTIDDHSLAIVWDGARSGLIFKGKVGSLGSTLMKITPMIVERNYIFYFLQRNQSYIQSKTKGSGIPHVDPEVLWNLKIPLPSLLEQKRIINKIEEFFSELDKSIEDLKKSKKQLEIYQQVLLSKAFSGKLTEKWRKDNNSKSVDVLVELINSEKKQQYMETVEEWKKLVTAWEENGRKGKRPFKPSKPVDINKIKPNDINNLPVIPKEWKWIRNNDLLYYITSGSRDWKKYYSKNGAYFIRTQDIKTNKLELKNAAYVDLPLNVEGKRSLVEKGDLLMTITGANVGKIAYIKDNIKEAYVSQSVALMKPVNSNIVPYLHLYFQSEQYGAKLMNDLVYGVGRPVLSLENMREVLVALCSLEEQKEIISIIESETSIIENLKRSITNSIFRCEVLRQSILKQAFEGKLTEQNKAESDSDLLKKITFEKEKYFLAEKLNRQTTKKPKMEPVKKAIIDILKEKKSPLSAKELWELSIYSKDIDGFYAELKKHIESGTIEELPRKGKESSLILKK